MPLLGAHMSISGGYYKAAERGAEVGCEVIQLFTKNNNQWRAKEITPDDAAQFQAKLKEHGISHPIAHDSYLINLASPDEALWEKSVAAFRDELLRCQTLGIPWLVTHPGAFTTSDEKTGLQRIVTALDEVHRQQRGLSVLTLLETTAGQGSTLGWRFEQLANILENCAESNRLGVCVDTCHIFAAGYEFDTPRNFKATMKELDATVGLKRVKAFHLNDSKTPLGSRVDRHAHIGRGHLGLEPFRLLLNDPRFRKTPMYLETAKEQENGVEMDVVNLATLRALIDR